jgi:hypothetical protein
MPGSTNFRNFKTCQFKYTPSLIDRLRAAAWLRGSQEPIKCKTHQNTPLGRVTDNKKCSACKAAQQYIRDVADWMRKRGLLEDQ